MTVSSTTARVSYSGNGATTAFTVPFYFLASSHLRVVLRSAAGVESEQVLTTDYSVIGAGEASGGTVTMVTAPASGETLVITRAVPVTQETNLLPNDPLPAESLEQALDKLTMIVAQQQETLDRALVFPVTDAAAAIGELPVSDDRASKYLAFGADGKPVATAGTTSAIVASAFGESLIDDANAAAARATLGLGSAAVKDAGTASGQVPLVGTASATEALAGAAELATQTETDAGTDDARFVTPLKLATYSRWSDILPRGHLSGLTLSNNGTDPTNDIDIAAGEAKDSTNAVDLVLASALTKRLDAAWAVGTNQGGLDTGAIANDVYHVWLIRRSDTGVVDVLFSASASAPTMPTNYDQKRRIGSIIRSGGAILAFDQLGDRFLLDTPVLDINVTNPGTSAVTRTLASVPDGVVVAALLTVNTVNSAASEGVYLSALASADLAPSTSAAPLQTCGTSGAAAPAFNDCEIVTNTSAQVRSRSRVGDANTTLRIVTRGWIDHRGRFD